MDAFDQRDTALAPHPIDTSIRLLTQFAGLALVGGGAYFAINVLITGVNIARSPKVWETALDGMAKTLKVEGAELAAAGGGKVAIGRTLAGSVLLLWNAVVAWVAILLIGVGGRLAAGASAGQRELITAIRESFASMRAAGRLAANEQDRAQGPSK